MPFHQVLVSCVPGDAISNAALELRALLRRAGRSEIFARYIHPEMMDEAFPLDEYEQRTAGNADHEDVLLFHASIGEPAVFAFLESRPERLVLIYHNISPAETFRPYDPAFAGLLDGGRRELAALAGRCVLAMAVSQFNADELIALGYDNVSVTRLVVDVDRLRNAPPDDEFRDWVHGLDGPVLLFVGQLLPHKRPDLLIEAFHVLSTYLLPEAHLLMVGAAPLPAYAQRLSTFIDELSLSRVHMLGRLPAGKHAAAYRGADGFVTASEHEGFCVPLLEAMAVELPIVARAHGAIPETLGDAGVLLPPESGALLLAEAMLEVVTDVDLRGELVRRGLERLPLFDPDQARAAVLEQLLGVL